MLIQDVQPHPGQFHSSETRPFAFIIDRCALFQACPFCASCMCTLCSAPEPKPEPMHSLGCVGMTDTSLLSSVARRNPATRQTHPSPPWSPRTTQPEHCLRPPLGPLPDRLVCFRQHISLPRRACQRDSSKGAGAQGAQVQARGGQEWEREG